MIRSFKCKETKKTWEQTFSKKFSKDIQQKAFNKLVMIYSASNINDLRLPPSNHLEQLIGDRKGRHSIMINKQWRICFIWEESGASNVEITDYH